MTRFAFRKRRLQRAGTSRGALSWSPARSGGPRQRVYSTSTVCNLAAARPRTAPAWIMHQGRYHRRPESFLGAALDHLGTKTEPDKLRRAHGDEWRGTSSLSQRKGGNLRRTARGSDSSEGTRRANSVRSQTADMGESPDQVRASGHHDKHDTRETHHEAYRTRPGVWNTRDEALDGWKDRIPVRTPLNGIYLMGCL